MRLTGWAEAILYVPLIHTGRALAPIFFFKTEPGLCPSAKHCYCPTSTLGVTLDELLGSCDGPYVFEAEAFIGRA